MALVVHDIWTRQPAIVVARHMRTHGRRLQDISYSAVAASANYCTEKVMPQEKIADYTYAQFLELGDALAQGQAPSMTGRRCNLQQWRILITLAHAARDRCISEVEKNAWADYINSVIATKKP